LKKENAALTERLQSIEEKQKMDKVLRQFVTTREYVVVTYALP
jgi:hypothetical protein